MKVRFSTMMTLVLLPIAVYTAGVGGLAVFAPGEVASASQMNANFQYLMNNLRRCPDDMEEVGDACIDRFEASLWNSAYGGQQYTDENLVSVCPKNGAGCEGVFARSVGGVQPATGVSWYQAAIACANSGKHLPSNAKWQSAATGTPDALGGCITGAGSAGNTGNQPSCNSKWGVKDLIGNAEEWVADWQGVIGDNGEPSIFFADTGEFPELDYGGDAYMHGGLSSFANAPHNSDGSFRVDAGDQIVDGGLGVGTPPGYAAVIRGGSYNSGDTAGAFAYRLDRGPAAVSDATGFRCARNR